MILSRAGRWIYAARECDGLLIKIGSVHFPGSAAARVRQVERQWHTTLTLLAQFYAPSYGFSVERTVHQLLQAARIQSEWFYLHLSQDELDRLTQHAHALVCARVAHQRQQWQRFYARQQQRMRLLRRKSRA